jgi:hypothetical protein
MRAVEIGRLAAAHGVDALVPQMPRGFLAAMWRRV